MTRLAGMRILAVLGDDTFAYRLVFLLHLLTVIVGFGSSFVYPVMGREARVRKGVEAYALTQASLRSATAITTPPIYLAGVTGILLVIMSDAIGFDEAWISIAFVLFIVSAIVAGALHLPNLKRMEELVGQMAGSGAAAGAPPEGGPPSQLAELELRGKRAGMYSGILHLAFLGLMIDMIWKPGSIFT